MHGRSMFHQIDWFLIYGVIVLIVFMIGMLIGGMIAERGMKMWMEEKTWKMEEIRKEEGHDHGIDNRSLHRWIHRDDDHGNSGIIEELGQA